MTTLAPTIVPTVPTTPTIAPTAPGTIRPKIMLNVPLNMSKPPLGGISEEDFQTKTNVHTTSGPAKVSPSLKQTKPIPPPRPPLIRPKGKEVRICLPSITEIYGSIYNEIHKRVIETLTDVLDRVSEDYKINADELKEKYLKELKVVLEKNQEEVKKIGVPTIRKPRTVLPGDIRCMARTANGEQCTRRKQKDNGYDFCGSHCNNQPYGKVGDAPLIIAEKKKRGRPPKKTVIIDGVAQISGSSESSESQSNNDAPESPYDDTTSLDFVEIKDGEQNYICNKNTKIVYEIPQEEQIADISELTRVGIWDPEQGVITYDNI